MMSSKSPSFRRPPLRIAIALALASSFTSMAQANTVRWTGGLKNLSWSVMGRSESNSASLISNWSPGAKPANGDSLVFQGIKGLQNNNDYAALTVAAITFDANAGAFVLSGNTLLTNGNITNNSSNRQTFNMALTPGGSSEWLGGVGGLLFNGQVGINDANLTLKGGVTIDNATQQLFVGKAGTGTLNIENGSVVNTAAAYIGAAVGSKGSIKVTGVGSQWNNSKHLFVAEGGSATLNIENGGLVKSLSSFVGYAQGGSGVVTVTGTGSKWSLDTELRVGSDGTGSLTIENGGAVSNATGFVGGYTSIYEHHYGNGAVKVSGTGSQWNNTDKLSVGVIDVYGSGRSSSGSLSILDSGKVSALDLAIGSKGIVNLDGGTLQITTASVEPGGAFNWSKGTLSYTGDASIGAGLLKKTTTLADGQTLAAQNTLTVGAGRMLVLDGGQFAAKTLALNGGSMVSNGAVDLANTGTLLGHGLVAGTVAGGADNTISASGGTLTLGNADVKGGYAFRGTLNIQQGAHAQLQSADKAQLGTVTNLAEGAKLVTDNGANLGAGNRLNFSGHSSIQGDFTNNGSVAANTGTAGSLSFLNDVDGAGSYAGNIVFKAGFKPGNSPAAVDFGGGDVSFDAASVLDIELFGSAPGTQYDQLLGINKLTFNGKLNLIFGNGYAPAPGSQLTLFDFQAFAGSFAAEHITVTGYDKAKLDFSRLGVDGSLNVTAVPEPGSWALMLAGLLAVGGIARRRTAQTAG